MARYAIRDQIGHWVKPPGMRGHPCPHMCCRNRRPHPASLPVKLNRDYLRSLSEDEVIRELEQYSRYSDVREHGFMQVLAEANRRELSRERGEARKERRMDRYQRRQAEWKDEVYRQWLQAENATKGVMLNKEGRRRGIDERSLFTGSEARVTKYASPELFEWFEQHGRPTRAAFLGSARERKLYHAGRRIGLPADHHRPAHHKLRYHAVGTLHQMRPASLPGGRQPRQVSDAPIGRHLYPVRVLAAELERSGEQPRLTPSQLHIAALADQAPDPSMPVTVVKHHVSPAADFTAPATRIPPVPGTGVLDKAEPLHESGRTWCHCHPLITTTYPPPGNAQ